MSHYFDVPLSLAIAALTPSMVDTAGTGTLIFPGGAALPRPTSPLTAHLAAVALPTVACRAHQHFGLAASARIGTCADQVFGIHLQIPSPNARTRVGPCWWAARWSNLLGYCQERRRGTCSSHHRRFTAPWPWHQASIQTGAQHFLYFFPDPQGHGSLRPILCDTAGCLMTAMRSPTLFIVW